jgi:hypothetical protein
VSSRRGQAWSCRPSMSRLHRVGTAVRSSFPRPNRTSKWPTSGPRPRLDPART